MTEPVDPILRDPAARVLRIVVAGLRSGIRVGTGRHGRGAKTDEIRLAAARLDWAADFLEGLADGLGHPTQFEKLLKDERAAFLHSKNSGFSLAHVPCPYHHDCDVKSPVRPGRKLKARPGQDPSRNRDQLRELREAGLVPVHRCP